MDTKALLALVDQLQGDLDELEHNAQPLISGALSTTREKLPLLERAKLNVLLVYAIESLLFSYLKLAGIEARNHAVFTELQRVKQYFEKIKEAEDRSLKNQPSLTLNKEAVQRVIKHALAGNAKYDQERADRESREKARANGKLRTLEATMQDAASAAALKANPVAALTKGKATVPADARTDPTALQEAAQLLARVPPLEPTTSSDDDTSSSSSDSDSDDETGRGTAIPPPASSSSSSGSSSPTNEPTAPPKPTPEANDALVLPKGKKRKYQSAADNHQATSESKGAVEQPVKKQKSKAAAKRKEAPIKDKDSADQQAASKPKKPSTAEEEHATSPGTESGTSPTSDTHEPQPSPAAPQKKSKRQQKIERKKDVKNEEREAKKALHRRLKAEKKHRKKAIRDAKKEAGKEGTSKSRGKNKPKSASSTPAK